MKTNNLAIEPEPENITQAVVYGWNRFWFRPADPTPLGLIRICAGMVIFYIHLCYCYDLVEFFGPNSWVDLPAIQYFREHVPHFTRSQNWKEMPDYQPPANPDPVQAAREKEEMLKWDGLDPRQAFAQGYYAWSIFFHVTDPTWLWIIHITHLGIFFLLTIGFCTRIVSVLAWLAAMSYIQRSPATLYGQDTILNFVLMYLMIGPSGAALSVDRLIERYSRTWRKLRGRASSRKAALHPEDENLELAPPAPSISANLALRLLQIHICIVYLASGLSKLQGNSWWNGTAIWGTMANPEFSPVYWQPYKDFLVYISSHRYLWELVMNTTAILTLVFEISFAFLVWNRWLRWTMVVSAVMLHTGIAFFMSLTTFSLIMVCAVISFIPAEAMHEFLARFGRGRRRFQVAFALRDRRQVRAASLVHALDVWDQVELSPDVSVADGRLRMAESLDNPQAKDGWLSGYALFERLVRSLPLLWPVAGLTWIPGVAGLGQSRFPGQALRTAPAPVPERERTLVKG